MKNKYFIEEKLKNLKTLEFDSPDFKLGFVYALEWVLNDE